ncbi:hypothetical protein SAMN04489712_10231 [Thermomonospora echinospora]|uniref:Lipoprotein n=1 Tax=Thermomonospora echinospora TaxID=1992 RepID=A0A1H5UU36_9ACTN|nr:hypothetical protein [Thermomonospora echinospora]SEF78642.1 hypothetical protein SAMN04489712_10231 [Thermomonospora echinospora]
MTGWRDVLSHAVVALALTGGAAACGENEPSARPPSFTSPPQAQATAPTATPEAVTTPVSPGSTRAVPEGVPIYRPSTVVSRVSGATVLTTPDPVEKVGAFYSDAIERGGWQSISKNATDTSVNFTVERPGKGATISISSTGSGTLISLSGHSVP